jgi:diadenosine tetraphosphatase ApaH/serine/threonine PP2A family protein phosphatase
LLALLYDIHGNLPALEAVLADASAAGAKRFVLGGDYALFGPWPVETVETLRGLDAVWIRGNGERWTAHPFDAPDQELIGRSTEWARDVMGEELVNELDRLPEHKLLDGVLYCHASPVSDVRSFMPEPGEDEEELLTGVAETRLVFGHTHLPFRRTSARGIELVNPGSVGMPFDGDTRAAYAIMGDDGEIDHRRVKYDHGESAAAVRERLGPWAETIAGRIEQARFDV